MTAADASVHKPGDEPLRGYTLTRPLGRGGFGEVWACVAPGGLKKAVKFVSAGDDGEAAQFRQELEAFERIKEIRHPFLLSLERVEVVGGELVMVMELADQQLQDRFDQCRAAGRRGIPRTELVGYLTEAAEALDLITGQFGLQHLDVKPANLFVTAGHVKVGDYGLVASLDAAGDGHRGLTPKFVAPEVLRGTVHTRSDQYSLALVYCELLTGVFPYPAKTPQQMMLAHVSSQPDVSALPACDRGPVWTALQKKPEDRFPTCLDFVHALQDANYLPEDEPPQPPAGRSTVISRVTRVVDTTPPAGEQTGRHPQPPLPADGPRPGEATQSATWRTVPRMVPPVATTPGPRLVTPGMSNPGARLVPPGSSRPGVPLPPMHTPAPPPTRGPFSAADVDLPLAEPEPAQRVRVNPIRSVIPAGLLRGEDLPRAAVSAADVAQAVVRAAAGGAHVPQLPGDLGRTADGAWVGRFPSTVPAQVVPLKLSVLQQAWAVAVEQPEPGLVVLRRAAGGGGWFSKKKAGFSVEVRLPKGGKAVGEVTVTGALVGEPDRQFVQVAADAIPRLVADVRRELGNVEDRRKHPRLATTMPVTVHPLHSDGTPDEPVRAACVDVSVGGLAFTLREAMKTRYAYLEFDAVPDVAGLAVLVRVVRAVAPPLAGETVFGVQYRIDL